jgi:hypothetical protein
MECVYHLYKCFVSGASRDCMSVDGTKTMVLQLTMCLRYQMAQRLHLDELNRLYNTITPHLERLCNTSLDTTEHKFVYGVLDLYQHLSAGTSTLTPRKKLDPPHSKPRASPHEQRSASHTTGPVPVDISKYFAEGESHLRVPIKRTISMHAFDIVINQLLSDRTYWWSQFGGLKDRFGKVQAEGWTYEYVERLNDEVGRLNDQVIGFQEQLAEDRQQFAVSSLVKVKAAVKIELEKEEVISKMNHELETKNYELNQKNAELIVVNERLITVAESTRRIYTRLVASLTKENEQLKKVRIQDEEDMGKIDGILQTFIQGMDETMRTYSAQSTIQISECQSIALKAANDNMDISDRVGEVAVLKATFRDRVDAYLRNTTEEKITDLIPILREISEDVNNIAWKQVDNDWQRATKSEKGSFTTSVLSRCFARNMFPRCEFNKYDTAEESNNETPSVDVNSSKDNNMKPMDMFFLSNAKYAKVVAITLEDIRDATIKAAKALK